MVAFGFLSSHFNYFSTIQNGHADSSNFRLQLPVPGSSEVVRYDPTAGPSRLLTLRLPGKTTGTTTTCTITCGVGPSCCHSIARSQQLIVSLCEYLLDGFHNYSDIRPTFNRKQGRSRIVTKFNHAE